MGHARHCGGLARARESLIPVCPENHDMSRDSNSTRYPPSADVVPLVLVVTAGVSFACYKSAEHFLNPDVTSLPKTRCVPPPGLSSFAVSHEALRHVRGGVHNSMYRCQCHWQ